jgi:hypothetical protein
MLRSNPKPPGKYCLSIDPGTQNAGVCAFNSTSQTIAYWNRHKLLDAHEQVVRSTDQVKRYLDSITDNVEAALKSNDYWVLVEEQPWDSDSKKGIVFNLQLQQAIVMYYLCKGKSVRVLSASERYKFLGIQNWQQMTRHFRKVSAQTLCGSCYSREKTIHLLGATMTSGCGKQHESPSTTWQMPWARCFATFTGLTRACPAQPFIGINRVYICHISTICGIFVLNVRCEAAACLIRGKRFLAGGGNGTQGCCT